MTTTSELNFSHTHMAPQDPHFGADEIWAAETLLMLSHGLRRPSSTEYRPPATTVPAAAATPKKPKIILRIKKTHFTSSSLPYVCDVCGASFASHQALGGHKTCHRPKNSAAAASGGGAADQEHECSDCQARFPTGQALGGHKRKHYEGMIVSAEKTKKRDERMKVLDFDLNLPYIQID